MTGISSPPSTSLPESEALKTPRGLPFAPYSDTLLGWRPETRSEVRKHRQELDRRALPPNQRSLQNPAKTRVLTDSRSEPYFLSPNMDPSSERPHCAYRSHASSKKWLTTCSPRSSRPIPLQLLEFYTLTSDVPNPCSAAECRTALCVEKVGLLPQPHRALHGSQIVDCSETR